MGTYVELIKASPEDNQRIIRLKEEFNKDAEDMNLNWPRLSMERRRELTNKMRTIRTEIATLL